MNPWALLFSCGKAVPGKCVAFKALEAGSTIAMETWGQASYAPSVTLEYSRDGKRWSPFVVGTTTITLSHVGAVAYIRGDGNTAIGSYYGGNRFVLTGKLDAEGNARYLISQHTISQAGKTYALSRVFENCTALVRGPELEEADNDYGNNYYFYSVYSGCTGLKDIPKMAHIGKDSYLNSAFAGCTSLEEVDLGVGFSPYGTKRNTGRLSRLFFGCSSLRKITVAWTAWPAVSYSSIGEYVTSDWLSGVAETGVFRCPEALAIPSRDASGVPANWTIERY